MRMSHFVIAAAFMAAAGYAFAGPVQGVPAGETVPSVAQKKVLVVYYSRTGNTKRAAEDIARALHADIERLIDKKDRAGAGGYFAAGMDATRGKQTELEPLTFDPSRYDLVVIGTPVWSWTMTPAVRTYLDATRARLNRFAVFTTSGGTKPDKIVARIEAIVGKKAVGYTGLFASDLNEKSRSRYDEKIGAFVAALR
jgi:flavodoxin